MNVKKLLKPLLGIGICIGLYFFCQSQTKGFRPYLILSNLPNDSRWEVPPVTAQEKMQIDALLDQPFTFLGSGGWCYAFLGQDQQTVLKFYKHSHLRLPTILSECSLKKLLFKSDPYPEDLPYFQEFNFKSCTLLYRVAKERTGLLYVHLNKTEGLHHPVTLIDNIGVRHVIDLDKTEFVIQKKAELLLSHLERLAKQKKMVEAKQCIDDLFACLLTLYKNGAKDYDHALKNNFGFVDGKAVTLDLSSFGTNDSLKHPANYKKEIVIKTKRLSRWLEKHFSELHTYYEAQLSELMEKG